MKRILKIVLVMLLLAFSFGIVYSSNVISRAPKIDTYKMDSLMPEKSIIYDDSGKAIDNLFTADGNRTNIEYSDLPKNMINAIVAIEDKTFWTHHGFNFWRIGGAVKDSLFSGGQISGTSTLTQQLARNLYLKDIKSVRSVARKLAEAYYTQIIERHLSKKQIMTAYMNTIYFGYNTYGIQSAARAYFDKDVKDLDLQECVALAAIPKASGRYALVTRMPRSGEYSEDGSAASSKDERKVLTMTDDFVYLYNGDASKERRDLILKLMHESGKISKQEMDKAKSEDLSKKIKISNIQTHASGYFNDMLIDEVTQDLMDKYDYTRQEARTMIYTGGLRIYSSLNSKAQDAIESTFEGTSLFPSVINVRYNQYGNIIGDGGGILLYKYSNTFDDKERLILRSQDYSFTDDGSLLFKKGRKIHFYKTKVNGSSDYSPNIHGMYLKKNGVFYIVDGGIILIPSQYKKLDKDGNLVISKKFLHENKNFYTKLDNTIRINHEYVSLGSTARQPQAAMVIVDYRTGQVKAMLGGRGITGKKLYNRANNPRQPGSSIKPISVYSAAIQQGRDAAKNNKPMSFNRVSSNDDVRAIGSYWTASSGINDAPLYVNGRKWPKNWYAGYRGMMTLRKSLEQSVNVTAVRIYLHLTPKYCMDLLEKFGVTSLVRSGKQTDRNPAALALGGMTKGISPLEMAGAYGTFPNRGVRKDNIFYTKITDKSGDIILENKAAETRVLSKSVAFIMQDLLRTTVTRGLGSAAKVPGKATCGKTGTTTDARDFWFCGFTGQYSAALWVGNDVGLDLSGTSTPIARIWSLAMRKATAGVDGYLPGKPDGVIRRNGEYYAAGTQNGVTYRAKSKEEIEKEKEKKRKKLEEEKKRVEERRKNEGQEGQPSQGNSNSSGPRSYSPSPSPSN